MPNQGFYPLYVSAAGGLAVRDIDGTPSITATTLEFTNGTVTDQGGGVARVTIAGGGGGGGGGGGTPTEITVASEASDVSCFLAFFTSKNGDLGPKTNDNLTYNSSTSSLACTTFVGALTGTASGNALSSHVHGNITNAGAIGSNSGLPVVTTTSGVLTTGTLTGTGTVLVAATSPTLVTPNIGVATGTSISFGSDSLDPLLINSASSGTVRARLVGFNQCFFSYGYFGAGSVSGAAVSSTGAYAWSNNATDAQATNDTFLSRNAAGVVQIGTTGDNASGSLLCVGLGGNPTTTTQAASDNSTRIATTAFVKTAIPAQFAIVINTSTTGLKQPFHRVPYNCTITGWEIVGDVSGDVVIDLWKDPYSNYPPTVSDSITGSAKPTLTSATKASSTTLTGWTTALSAGDYIGANVDSRTSVTVVSLVLLLTRT